MQIPVDAYGPITMNGVTYASSDATQTTPLVNATVIIGPIPVTGATPPAPVPSGDVMAITTASGTFTATLTVAPSAASALEPFVIPQNNVLGFLPPASGYYIEAFAPGADGRSSGTIIPLHRFLPAAAPIALHVSTISSTEAAALSIVNADRATYSAPSLTFDESAEEIARLHATDEATAGYSCHYDTHNLGPSSRYLAGGGVGLTGENLGLTYGPDPISALTSTESAFIAERANVPQGGHFLNLVDATHAWAGLAVSAYVSAPGFFEIDQELVTPNGQSNVVGSSGYPNGTSCPAGTTINNS